MMSNFILMPDGNAISPAVIKGVIHIPGKGVVLRDAQNRLLSYLKTDNDEHGLLARNLIIKAIDEGVRSAQPEWAFLKN